VVRNVSTIVESENNTIYTKKIHCRKTTTAVMDDGGGGGGGGGGVGRTTN